MQEALSIYTDTDVLDKLKELDGGVIDSIQTRAVSEQVKNKNYSGTPESGSVRINRFVNAVIDDYGTARAAGKGKNVMNKPVVINIDTDKEIVEEIENKDLALGNVPDLLGRRAVNHDAMITNYLDTLFFNKVEAEGTEIPGISSADVFDALESIIQAVVETKNEFVNGVPREMLVLTVKPKLYAQLRKYIDSVDGTQGKTDYFNRVRIYENMNQTKDAICMIDGAVGQLVKINDYKFTPIELSDSSALAKFFYTGTKAVMPDLIKYADLTETI